MAKKRDFYKVLGVDRSADPAAIKKAYRKLAKKYHPDTNKGNASAEERFKEITEAYDILNDTEKKKLYDQYGMLAFECGFNEEVLKQASRASGSYGGFEDIFRNAGKGQRGKRTYSDGRTTYTTYGSGGPDGFAEYHFDGDPGGMDDLLSHLFGGGRSSRKGQTGRNQKGRYEQSYSNPFGQGGGYRYEQSYGDPFGGAFGSQPMKGQDVNARIDITFDEAVHGCDKIITYQDEKGLKQTLKVHIPAGVDTGKKLRLSGKGTKAPAGGNAGDLYLEVTVGEKKGFERKGQDVYTTVQIPFTTAVFGGEAIVPTLYGNVSCKIKEGTQSGTKIRLKGKGIPFMNQPEKRGDQYATIQIEVPKHLGPEAKKKLREYQQAV